MKVFLAGRIAVEAEGEVIDERHFPGRQGRLLFAYLVAEHGRPAPRDELADVLWGDAPPATWDKALSVLVSKLRVVLTESGLDGTRALTAAFGCYQLDLPEGTWVDVLAAENAATDAEGFLEMDELESATAAAALAESLTRSPFLPGDDGPWVEEKRRGLAEVRARALTVLAETSLRTGKAAEAVRWAGLAIEAEPFRESGYRRLMEAHVAAGNRGEALRVYEQCRRLLAEELGAYPSPETESIYRSLLEAPAGGAAARASDTESPPGTAPPPVDRRKRPVLGAVALVLLVTVVAAGTAIAVVATRSEGPRPASVAQKPRVALVLPKTPPWSDDPSSVQYQEALNTARTQDGVATKTFPIDPSKPLTRSLRKSIGNFGLVLLAGQFVGADFLHEFKRHRGTRFIVVDPDPFKGSLFYAVSHNPNTSDVFFAEGPGARLAGYLSALMAEQHPGKRPVVVSDILVNKSVSQNVITTFPWGVREADSRVKVHTNYAGKFSPPSVCETIANQQIANGSRVIYADAGACNAGAVSAATGRRVWVIEGDQDPSDPPVDPQIIGYSVKNFRREVEYAIRHFVAHTLPRGHHIDIGIGSDAVNFSPTNLVPRKIGDKLEHYKQEHLTCWSAGRVNC